MPNDKGMAGAAGASTTAFSPNADGPRPRQSPGAGRRRRCAESRSAYAEPIEGTATAARDETRARQGTDDPDVVAKVIAQDRLGRTKPLAW